MEIDTVALGTITEVSMPRIGIGTWHMGEAPQAAGNEVAALRHARDLGFTHFDTAEMYATPAPPNALVRSAEKQIKWLSWTSSKDGPARVQMNLAPSTQHFITCLMWQRLPRSLPSEQCKGEPSLVANGGTCHTNDSAQ